MCLVVRVVGRIRVTSRRSDFGFKCRWKDVQNGIYYRLRKSGKLSGWVQMSEKAIYLHEDGINSLQKTLKAFEHVRKRD